MVVSRRLHRPAAASAHGAGFSALAACWHPTLAPRCLAAGVRALYNSFLYHSPPPNTDFVVMCSEGLAEEHRQLMRSWGITVIPVERVPNPPWGTWTHPACKGRRLGGAGHCMARPTASPARERHAACPRPTAPAGQLAALPGAACTLSPGFGLAHPQASPPACPSPSSEPGSSPNTKRRALRWPAPPLFAPLWAPMLHGAAPSVLCPFQAITGLAFAVSRVGRLQVLLWAFRAFRSCAYPHVCSLPSASPCTVHRPSLTPLPPAGTHTHSQVLVLDTDMIFLRPPGDLLAWCADDGPVVTLDMGPADFPPAGAPSPDQGNRRRFRAGRRRPAPTGFPGWRPPARIAAVLAPGSAAVRLHVRRAASMFAAQRRLCKPRPAAYHTPRTLQACPTPAPSCSLPATRPLPG